MDHRYGLQRGWENNSALESYGPVDDPNFRVDGSYDDRRFLDDRYVSESGYPRSGFHRDIVERESYPPQPVGLWPQARRRGYEDDYSVERESRRPEKAYADSYTDYDSRRVDSYRDHEYDRSSKYTGRDHEDYGYDDYDYRTRISSREDTKERGRDYEYGRHSYDSDYEGGSRRDGSWRRRDSLDRARSRGSVERDRSPYRRHGGSRSSSRGRDDRLRSSSRGKDDRLRSSSRGQDDRLRSSSRGQDDRLRSSSRGQNDRLRSRSRGRDDRLRSRSPQRRSRSRSRREDSYDDIYYERSDRRRDYDDRYRHDLFSVAPSATVVVKGLSHKTTEEDLYQILAEWGPLRHVRVIKERNSGTSRGFAFIDFPIVSAAQAMMDRLGDEGLVVDGRKLFFEYSSKPTGSASGPLGSDMSRSGHSSHRSMAIPSDWMCTFCDCVNFARRTSCFQCNEPRTDDAPSADMASSNPISGKRGEAGPTHVLVVRGLDENADEEILRYEFSKHAPIKDLRLVRDKFTHVSRGFAFVHFYSVEDATKALEATNGTTLEKNGQILRVAYAKSVLGPGSGTSGTSQSSSLAAAAIEAATFSQQYDAVGWTPKEYNPDDNKQPAGGQEQVAGVNSQSGAGAPQSNFVWDEASGYYYDASSGFYYDGNTGLYYDGNNGIWYTYDHQTQQYAPYIDQNDKASEKKSEAADGSSNRKVVISAPAATINTTGKAVSLPDAIQAAANAAIAAEKKEKEKAKEIRLASKSSILANKKKMSNVLTMWKHRSHEGQAPRVALEDNPAATPEDRANAVGSSTKNKLKTDAVTTKEKVTVSAGFSTNSALLQTGEESQDRAKFASNNSGGGTIKGVIRGSGTGVVKSDTLYAGPSGNASMSAATSVGSSSLSNMDTSVTPFRTDSSALGSYASPAVAVSGKRRFSEMPTPQVSNKDQRQTTYRDRAAERRSLYGSSSSLGGDDAPEPGDSNRDSTYRRGAIDSMPFPPGVGGNGGRGAVDANVQSFEVITADRAIDENNVGNRMLRNMGWQEGLGLGKDGSGMVEPVQAQSTEKRAGLGSQPKKTDPSLEVQTGDSYRTLIQKKAIARFREMS